MQRAFFPRDILWLSQSFDRNTLRSLLCWPLWTLYPCLFPFASFNKSLFNLVSFELGSRPLSHAWCLQVCKIELTLWTVWRDLVKSPWEFVFSATNSQPYIWLFWNIFVVIFVLMLKIKSFESNSSSKIKLNSIQKLEIHYILLTISASTNKRLKKVSWGCTVYYWPYLYWSIKG